MRRAPAEPETESAGEPAEPETTDKKASGGMAWGLAALVVAAGGGLLLAKRKKTED